MFIEENFSTEFNKKGVVKLKLFDKAVLDEITDCFQSLYPDYIENFKSQYHFSIFNKDIVSRNKLHSTCKTFVNPFIDSIFSGYKIIGFVFQIKGIGPSSYVNIHQDLTIVDESKYSVYTIWVSLMDSNKENGAISFLEGSNNLFRGYRTHTINHNRFSNVEDYIKQESKTYCTKKGEALIFDPATIHFSNPNLSNRPRISIALSIVEQNTPIQIGFFDNSSKDKIEIYNVPDDFWSLYNDFEAERLSRPFFGKFSHNMNAENINTYERSDFIKKYDDFKKSAIY